MKKRVEEISSHPLNEEIYSLSNVDDLVFSIAEKGLLQPIILNQHDQIISGHRRFSAVKELGWDEVECEVVETTSQEEEAELLVHHNKQRVKTWKERVSEAQILFPLFRKGQGKRTDLTSVRTNRGSARDMVASTLGIPPTTLHKVLKIFELDPEMLDLVDKGQTTLHQAFVEVRKRQDDKEALAGRNRIGTPLTKEEDFQIYYKSSSNLSELEDQSVQLIFTSPPYWKKRVYVEGSIGNEPTPADFVDGLVSHLRECKRVLNDRGSFFLNLGDSRVDGNLQNIPHRVVIGLQDEGWILRSSIVWKKTNPKPQSAKDRLSETYEMIFHLVKQRDYHYIPTPTEPIYKLKEARSVYHRGGTDRKRNVVYPVFYNTDGKNMGDYWDEDVIKTAVEKNMKGQEGDLVHPAPFPEQLVILPLLQTTNENDLVLDPFSGSHTTGRVANRFGRRYVGYDIHDY